MEDAEPPNTVPHLNIQQEISSLAARNYLQARDEAVVTSIPPFCARGNSAFLYYNLGKEGVCVFVFPIIINPILHIHIIHLCFVASAAWGQSMP